MLLVLEHDDLGLPSAPIDILDHSAIRIAPARIRCWIGGASQMSADEQRAQTVADDSDLARIRDAISFQCRDAGDAIRSSYCTRK